jgi:type II secretion system protein G
MIGRKYNTLKLKKSSGFTIVELLIVIVVIGILAAITIVAYNGVQQRARYSAMQSDISSLNKAIQLYYADNGTYPYSGSGIGNVVGPSPAIPGLVPTYLSKIPTIPNDGIGGYYAYIWSTNGADYKLIRLVPNGVPLPSPEQANPHPDPARPGRGWGIWSSSGASL